MPHGQTGERTKKTQQVLHLKGPGTLILGCSVVYFGFQLGKIYIYNTVICKNGVLSSEKKYRHRDVTQSET